MCVCVCVCIYKLDDFVLLKCGGTILNKLVREREIILETNIIFIPFPAPFFFTLLA